MSKIFDLETQHGQFAYIKRKNRCIYCGVVWGEHYAKYHGRNCPEALAELNRLKGGSYD